MPSYVITKRTLRVGSLNSINRLDVGVNVVFLKRHDNVFGEVDKELRNPRLYQLTGTPLTPDAPGCSDIAAGPNGEIWLACAGRGLVRLNRDRNAAVFFRQSKIVTNGRKLLAVDAEGKVWFVVKKTVRDTRSPRGQGSSYEAFAICSLDPTTHKVTSWRIDDMQGFPLSLRVDALPRVVLTLFTDPLDARAPRTKLLVLDVNEAQVFFVLDKSDPYIWVDDAIWTKDNLWWSNEASIACLKRDTARRYTKHGLMPGPLARQESGRIWWLDASGTMIGYLKPNAGATFEPGRRTSTAVVGENSVVPQAQEFSTVDVTLSTRSTTSGTFAFLSPYFVCTLPSGSSIGPGGADMVLDKFKDNLYYCDELDGSINRLRPTI